MFPFGYTSSTPPCKPLAVPEKINSLRNYGKSTASSYRRQAGKMPGLETAISHLHLDMARKNLCSDHYRSWSFQQSPVLLLQVRQHAECQLAVNYPLFWRPGCYSRNQTTPLSPYHLHPSSFIHMYFQNFNQWAMMLHHSSSPRLVWAETDLKFKSMLTVEITVQSSKSSCCWRKGSVNGRKKALFSPVMLKVIFYGSRMLT